MTAKRPTARPERAESGKTDLEKAINSLFGGL